jgi:hypothetical protein
MTQPERPVVTRMLLATARRPIVGIRRAGKGIIQ